MSCCSLFRICFCFVHSNPAADPGVVNGMGGVGQRSMEAGSKRRPRRVHGSCFDRNADLFAALLISATCLSRRVPPQLSRCLFSNSSSLLPTVCNYNPPGTTACAARHRSACWLCKRHGRKFEPRTRARKRAFTRIRWP